MLKFFFFFWNFLWYEVFTSSAISTSQWLESLFDITNIITIFFFCFEYSFLILTYYSEYWKLFHIFFFCCSFIQFDLMFFLCLSSKWSNSNMHQFHSINNNRFAVIPFISIFFFSSFNSKGEFPQEAISHRNHDIFSWAAFVLWAKKKRNKKKEEQSADIIFFQS